MICSNLGRTIVQNSASLIFFITFPRVTGRLSHDVIALKGHLMQEMMTSFRDKPPQQMWIDQLLNGIQQWLNPNLMISSAPNNGLKGVESQSLLTPNKCQELVLNFNSEAPSWWGRPFWPKKKNIIKWDKSSPEDTVLYHDELRRGCNTRHMNQVHRTVSNDLSTQNSQESLCLRNQGMT